MRVYDIVLAFIRMLVALDFIRYVARLIMNGLYSYAEASVTRDITPLMEVRWVYSLADDIVGMIVTFAILLLAKPIARFAAKLSSTADTARQF